MQNFTAETWNEMGKKLFNEDFVQAQKYFCRAIAQKPFEPLYYHNSGRKCLSMDRFEDALADFSLVMRLNAEDDDSCHYKGVAYFFMGMYDLAIEAFRESIRLMVKNGVDLIPPTVDWAWMAYMRKGDPEAAKALLDEYIYEDMPCGADDMDYKQRCLMYMGKLSVEDFIAWIDPNEDVDGITCWYGIANYYRYVCPDEKLYREALEKTLAYETVHNAFGYKLALRDMDELNGKTETEGGNTSMDPKCMELEAYLKQNPTDHKKWFELGKLYFNDEFEKARVCLSMAVALEPFNVEYRFNRGRKCLSLDRFEEALADFAWCVRLDPDDGFKWHYLANAYFFLGMYEDALENYKNALARHLKTGRMLVPPAVDWSWMCLQRLGRPEEAKAYLMEHTYRDIPVEPSDLDYKNRILLYSGLKTLDEYIANDINYADDLDAITELYGIVNYYKWVEPDKQKAIEFNDKVLACKTSHACFAYKLALKDRADGNA